MTPAEWADKMMRDSSASGLRSACEKVAYSEAKTLYRQGLWEDTMMLALAKFLCWAPNAHITKSVDNDYDLSRFFKHAFLVTYSNELKNYYRSAHFKNVQALPKNTEFVDGDNVFSSSDTPLDSAESPYGKPGEWLEFKEEVQKVGAAFEAALRLMSPADEIMLRIITMHPEYGLDELYKALLRGGYFEKRAQCWPRNGNLLEIWQAKGIDPYADEVDHVIREWVRHTKQKKRVDLASKFVAIGKPNLHPYGPMEMNSIGRWVTAKGRATHNRYKGPKRREATASGGSHNLR